MPGVGEKNLIVANMGIRIWSHRPCDDHPRLIYVESFCRTAYGMQNQFSRPVRSLHPLPQPVSHNKGWRAGRQLEATGQTQGLAAARGLMRSTQTVCFWEVPGPQACAGTKGYSSERWSQSQTPVHALH